MKKKHIRNKLLIISSAIMIMASAIGGIAYAKYATKVTGYGGLSIAKWNFTANGANETMEEISLGRELYDAKKISDGVIAPGTHGSFDIKINAKGTQTGVNYKVSFPEYHNKPTNMYFKVGDKVCKSFYELGKELSGSFEADDTEKTITKTVNWYWDYETSNNGKTVEENDAIDTEEGENGYRFQFIVEVIGTQSKTV